VRLQTEGADGGEEFKIAERVSTCVSRIHIVLKIAFAWVAILTLAGCVPGRRNARVPVGRRDSVQAEAQREGPRFVKESRGIRIER
jgi:hypothetical protein